MSIQKIFRKVPSILWLLLSLALILCGGAFVVLTLQAAPAGKSTLQRTVAASNTEESRAVLNWLSADRGPTNRTTLRAEVSPNSLVRL